MTQQEYDTIIIALQGIKDHARYKRDTSGNGLHTYYRGHHDGIARAINILNKNVTVTEPDVESPPEVAKKMAMKRDEVRAKYRTILNDIQDLSKMISQTRLSRYQISHYQGAIDNAEVALEEVGKEMMKLQREFREYIVKHNLIGMEM